MVESKSTKTIKKKISKLKNNDSARKLENRLEAAADKADKKIRKKLDKPFEELTEEEMLYIDKEVQATLPPQQKAQIGVLRRAKIMDYLLKVEIGELDLNKTEIAKLVNITNVSLSIYINDPDFQREYRKRCNELVEVMKTDRISACRRIATNGLRELEDRTQPGRINKIHTETLMKLTDFAVNLMKNELGEPTDVKKTIVEGHMINETNVNIKEQFADNEFRKGVKDLIKKTATNLTVLSGGKASGDD